MERVLGIGGIFFKSADPEGLKQWYVDNLGIEPGEGGYVTFGWRTLGASGRDAYTVWGPFPESTKYFVASSGSKIVLARRGAP